MYLFIYIEKKQHDRYGIKFAWALKKRVIIEDNTFHTKTGDERQRGNDKNRYFHNWTP